MASPSPRNINLVPLSNGCGTPSQPSLSGRKSTSTEAGGDLQSAKDRCKRRHLRRHDVEEAEAACLIHLPRDRRLPLGQKADTDIGIELGVDQKHRCIDCDRQRGRNRASSFQQRLQQGKIIRVCRQKRPGGGGGRRRVGRRSLVSVQRYRAETVGFVERRFVGIEDDGFKALPFAPVEGFYRDVAIEPAAAPWRPHGT